jgi:predicted metal-dependent phosphoesterase TrpH
MGQALLHVHTAFSDGTATVDQILDRLHADGEIDVVGFTDHDDVRAYAVGQDWKRRHPESRIELLWGVEQTIARFRHLLIYRFEPPFPEIPPRKFARLANAVREAKSTGGTVVVPHVEAFWVGMGRRQVVKHAKSLGIDGFELMNPYTGSDRSVRRLLELRLEVERDHDHGLLAIGGSDSHHLEDLYGVVVEFPGSSVADLALAFRYHTALPRWGHAAPPVPLAGRLRQHGRAWIHHPREQLQAWWEKATGAAV